MLVGVTGSVLLDEVSQAFSAQAAGNLPGAGGPGWTLLYSSLYIGKLLARVRGWCLLPAVAT